MKKVFLFLNKYKSNILLIYLFIQPFIDLITSICINIINIDFTIGMIIRFFFLIFLFIEFLFNSNSKHKKKEFIYLCLISLYLILFFIQILVLKGIDASFYELSNTLRCFYFPISLVLLIDYFEKEKFKINPIIWKYLFMIYIILIFIPTITNTGFNGYTQGKVGNIGWFNSSNEISAILSLLLPLFIYGLAFNKNKIITIIELILTLYVIFNLGSKIVILACGIIILYYGFVYIKKWFINKELKKIGIVTTIVILFIIIASLLIPKTNFYKNIKIHLDFLQVKNITEIITNPKIFDHFIFSSRLTFLKNTASNYENSSVSEKLLGIGYIENYGTDDVSLKMIEIDPCDIFLRHGILGFIIYFLSFIYILVEIKKKHHNETIENNYLLSIIIGIILMCLSGHVLTSPAVSIYLSIIMIILLMTKNNDNKTKKMK